jgi:hypothetical protein
MSIMVSSASSRSFIQKRPAPTFPRRRRGPHGPASSSVQTAESRPRGSTCKQETSGNSVELDQLERHHHPFERIEVVPLSNCESSVVLSDEEGAEEFTQSAWMTVYRK